MFKLGSPFRYISSQAGRESTACLTGIQLCHFFASCVTSSKSLNCSLLWFPHLESEDDLIVTSWTAVRMKGSFLILSYKIITCYHSPLVFLCSPARMPISFSNENHCGLCLTAPLVLMQSLSKAWSAQLFTQSAHSPFLSQAWFRVPAQADSTVIVLKLVWPFFLQEKS
jgi:hypothetical protein